MEAFTEQTLRWREGASVGLQSRPDLWPGDPVWVDEGKLSNDGARVLFSMVDSSAWWAGLNEGDLIQSVDKRPVRGPSDLQHIMDRSFPGQTCRIAFRRSGEPGQRDALLKVEAKDIPAERKKPLPAGVSAASEPSFRQAGSGAGARYCTGRVRGPAEVDVDLTPLPHQEVVVSADSFAYEDREHPAVLPAEVLQRLSPEEARAQSGRTFVTRTYRLGGKVSVKFSDGTVVTWKGSARVSASASTLEISMWSEATKPPNGRQAQDPPG